MVAHDKYEGIGGGRIHNKSPFDIPSLIHPTLPHWVSRITNGMTWQYSVALYSAKYSADRIKQAFETNDFSEASLKPYEMKLRSGTEICYEFIRLYYKLLPAFTYFIKSEEHRLDVLRLLQDKVIDRREVPVVDAMQKFIHTVETTPGHAFAAVLSDIPID